MATLRVTLALLALFAVQLAAQPQSRFTQPRGQADEMRFRNMDANNDGVVTRQEWRGSAQSFGVHDWNNDGILSGDELRPGFWSTGTGADAEADPAAGERDDRFEYLDANKNGRIERSEWHDSDTSWTWLDRNNDNVLSRDEVVDTNRRAVPRGSPTGMGASTGTAGRQDCTSSAAEIVDDVYQQVLERPADQASAAMTQALANGRMTVRDIVARVAKSPEHAERFFWQPVVSAVYRQVMQRDPSGEELRVGSAFLSGGRGRLLDFVAQTATRAANNKEDAVRILYQRLLGRDPDPSGLRTYTEMANREGIEAVARSIVKSREYGEHAGADRVPNQDVAAYQRAVQSLYRHVLGRDPDPVGLKDLTNVAAMNGFDAVVDRMVASAEYHRLFGDNVVPGRNSRYCGTTR